MLEWPQAAPMIGVILTVFATLFGLIWAGRQRAAQSAAAGAAVPAAIAGAMAERGMAEALTMAITGLTAVLVKGVNEAEQAREDEVDLRKRQFDAAMEEVRKIRIMLEVRAASGR